MTSTPCDKTCVENPRFGESFPKIVWAGVSSRRRWGSFFPLVPALRRPLQSLACRGPSKTAHLEQLQRGKWRRGTLALALFLLIAAGCDPGARVSIVAKDGTPRASVKVEIADTAFKREVGLMYRKQLAPDGGMIFVFPREERLTFWMKNTEIPLDMIFITSNLRVNGIIADAQPFSEDRLTVPGAYSQYVLEVNGGFCKRHGIQVADRVEFSGFSPSTVD
jgi:uncharacterized membrane protein (UPF0127 family)